MSFDPSMEFMWLLALASDATRHPLPESLSSPEKCGAVMQAIDGPDVLALTAPPSVLLASIGHRLGVMRAESAPLMIDVPDDEARLGLCLRLWAGGMDAGKALRPTYMTAAGEVPLPVAERTRAAVHFAARAGLDPVYRAGVVAAPWWRRHKRAQANVREGIPDGSPVLEHWVD